jgi:hypothetical protein
MGRRLIQPRRSTTNLNSANDDSLPCTQGRAGVGLPELAALLKYLARLLHPTLALPYYT